MGDKDLGSIREMDIKTISVTWVEKGHFRGDYVADSIEELRKIL